MDCKVSVSLPSSPAAMQQSTAKPKFWLKCQEAMQSLFWGRGMEKGEEKQLQRKQQQSQKFDPKVKRQCGLSSSCWLKQEGMPRMDEGEEHQECNNQQQSQKFDAKIKRRRRVYCTADFNRQTCKMQTKERSSNNKTTNSRAKILTQKSWGNIESLFTVLTQSDGNVRSRGKRGAKTMSQSTTKLKIWNKSQHVTHCDWLATGNGQSFCLCFWHSCQQDNNQQWWWRRHILLQQKTMRLLGSVDGEGHNARWFVLYNHRWGGIHNSIILYSWIGNAWTIGDEMKANQRMILLLDNVVKHHNINENVEKGVFSKNQCEIKKNNSWSRLGLRD